MLELILDLDFWMTHGWAILPIAMFFIFFVVFMKNADGSQFTLPVGGETSGKTRMPKNWKKNPPKPKESPKPTIWK